MLPEDVLTFWFSDDVEPFWWKKDEAFDQKIIERFSQAWHQATDGGFDHWAETALGRLALIILLDQMPRNMFRGDPKSFSSDQKALHTCLEGLDLGQDVPLPSVHHRLFFYLPLEHSEDLAHQQKCLELMTENVQDEEFIKFSRWHLEVIERFGRFPHRNEVLSRPSTQEEIAYLANGGHSF